MWVIAAMCTIARQAAPANDSVFRRVIAGEAMHILSLTQVLPYPLDAGPKVRAYYVLRHLARSHDGTLVSFVRPTDAEGCSVAGGRGGW